MPDCSDYQLVTPCISLHIISKRKFFPSRKGAETPFFPSLEVASIASLLAQEKKKIQELPLQFAAAVLGLLQSSLQGT